MANIKDKMLYFVGNKLLKYVYKNPQKNMLKLIKIGKAVAALKQKPPRLKLTKKQIIKTALLSLLFTMAGCGITFVISLLV